jgi:hypothetical protein
VSHASPILRLHYGAIKALSRLCQGSMEALLKLY